MARKLILLATVVAGVWLLGACADPVIGKWKQDKNETGCGKVEFEIEDDDGLVGDGEAPLPAQGGGCIDCEFDVEAEAKDDGKYSVELDFDNCILPGGSRNDDCDCKLNDDEDELDCDCDVLGDSTFEKQD